MLLAADLKTHLYSEQIVAIDRADSEIVDAAIAAAEQEAKGYLSRYDIDTIFNATGTNRDATLLMHLKDIATWHFITLANAGVDSEFRYTRYKDAIAWLKGVQSGKIVPYGFPVKTEDGYESSWLVSSDPKRETSY